MIATSLAALLALSGAVVEVEAESKTVLVLDFRAAPASAGRPYSAAAARAIQALGGSKVYTSADLAAVAQVEGERQTLGCDDGNNDCLAELAGALNAKYVLFGAVTEIGAGAVSLVSLTLFDVGESRAVRRATFENADRAALVRATSAATAALFAPRPSSASGAATGTGLRPANGWTITGASLLGLGLASTAGGLAVAVGEALPQEDLAADPGVQLVGVIAAVTGAVFGGLGALILVAE